MKKELTAHEHKILRASVERKVKDWAPALRLNQSEIDKMTEKGIDYAYENVSKHDPSKSKLSSFVAHGCMKT